MNRGYLITIFLLVIALIFTFQNTNTFTSLKFLFWKFDGSLAFITVTIFFLGFVGGLLLGLSNVLKKNRELRALKKTTDESSKTIPSSSPTKNSPS